MDGNFGIPQISKFISNTDLFDGKAEVAEKYAEKIKSGSLSNMAGYDLKSYKANMAKVIKL
ncbi:MAG: hypothetical protein K2Q22_17970 [Cytophagales bacterium]|nr:hypothetical protein [Cytophagales bacterium]